ncbi:unnamed protein product [Lampetra planeri]
MIGVARNPLASPRVAEQETLERIASRLRLEPPAVGRAATQAPRERSPCRASPRDVWRRLPALQAARSLRQRRSRGDAERVNASTRGGRRWATLLPPQPAGLAQGTDAGHQGSRAVRELPLLAELALRAVDYPGVLFDDSGRAHILTTPMTSPSRTPATA